MLELIMALAVSTVVQNAYVNDDADTVPPTAVMTLALVSGRTSGLSLSARETVCEETPHALATSLRVALDDMAIHLEVGRGC